MSDILQARAAKLIAAGYYVAPARGYILLTPSIDPRKEPYTAAEAARGPDLNIYLGLQANGRYLALLDLDSHSIGQDANAAKAAMEQAIPHVAKRIAWKRSPSGTGWHGLTQTTKRLPAGKIFDATGNHLGELLSRDDQRMLDPGDIQIATLTLTECEHLLDFWTIPTSDLSGEHWFDRAKQGERWAKGHKRIWVTKIELRAHLKRNCGQMGVIADALFDQHTPFDRSAKFASLVQKLMLHAHKLPGNRKPALWSGAQR